MTEVQRLIRVRRGIFDHHKGRILRGGLLTVTGIMVDGGQQVLPGLGGDDEVQESFHHVVTGHGGTVLLEIMADGLCRLLGLLMGEAEEGEDDEGQITLKRTLGLLKLYLFRRYVLTIQFLDGSDDTTADLIFNLHNYFIFIFFVGLLFAKVQKIFGTHKNKLYLCSKNYHLTHKEMNDSKKAFASKLLGIKAIKLQPNDPFTWASGWKSPIYTDNRIALSYPDVRSYVKLELCHAILENFPEATAVAGVATGAIAQGALVADELQLPYAYVRPKPKDHGTKNQIEGRLPEGSKVIVVEDLISTGSSSLKAVAALRAAGFEVVGMVASYTYGFPVAEQAFEEAGVKLVTLGDYAHTIEIAAETGYVSKDDLEVLHEWRKNPGEWKK